MKKRRSLIISLLLVAALTLGVGYAALTDDLFVTGTAGVASDDAKDAFAADVYFTKAVISADKGKAVIGNDKNGEASDLVTITVEDGVLAGKGDSVICSLEISNVGDLAANVTLDSCAPSNTEYFSVTTNWGSNTTQTLAAGGTLDIVVTITVLKTPTSDVTTTFDLGFTATAVEGTNP
ncbi:MAG: hypothetical protein IJD38_00065 [Clostridia bacterium]|nr:hypothetical protein [Clostridia bacterium]